MDDEGEDDDDGKFALTEKDRAEFDASIAAQVAAAAAAKKAADTDDGEGETASPPWMAPRSNSAL